MRVLIAEDDCTSRRMLEAFLVKWGYEVIVTTNGEEASRALESHDVPALAILDWMMPGKDGIQLCREVRKRRGRPYVYILLLTARGEKRDIVEGLEAGADDYLTKPFDPYELRARLRAGRRIVELQEQLRSAREALKDQALYDPLTGLRTQHAILAFLRKELGRTARDRSSLAVALIDIDHFSAINDTYGRLGGDSVLREVARRLLSAMRAYDALGRYGGEEFLAVVSRCDEVGAVSFAESFRARVDRKAIDTSEGMIPTTVSLGVAVASDASEITPGALVLAATTALFRAKTAGRNRVELARLEEAKKEAAAPEDEIDSKVAEDSPRTTEVYPPA
jgi:two-component system cell cycle response regulator